MILGRNITTITNTATQYVSLDAVKRHLRIESGNTDHDTYLGEMLSACFDVVDGILGYSSRKSTVEYLFSDVEPSTREYGGARLTVGSVLHIPARVISVSSVKYLDANGVEQTMTADVDYQQLKSFSGHYGFDLEIINAPANTYDYGWNYKVTVVEGFELSSANPANKSLVFPDKVGHAVKLLAGQYWSERMGIIVGTIQTEMSYNHEYLLSEYRIKEFI